MQGFVAPNAGELSGRVVDAGGHPVANATVHLIAKQNEHTVTTDANGQFKIAILEPTLVVVYGGVHVSGSTVTTVPIDGTEAIDVREALAPTKLAEPRSDPTVIPAYTDAMIDTNAWTRAWLLLEVSETGAVSRVKLINPPGYDLDAIAVRDAFKLSFEPARNRDDKPMVSLVLWKFEWPAYWWMKSEGHSARWLSSKALRVPCRGSGGTDTLYRDCSPPNMAAAMTAPWIYRSTK